MLAATARVALDLGSAEEAAQDAYAAALETWGERGIPDSPGAWLTTVARAGGRSTCGAAPRWRTAPLPKLLEPDAGDAAEHDRFADDRLRLVFTCCHPALAEEARVALTLRMVCGLSTADVASAFLVTEATMAARITRAKKKIAAARIPYRIPEPRGPAGTARLGAVGRPPRLHDRAHGARPAPRCSGAASPSGRSSSPCCCSGCCRASPRSRGCSPSSC